MVRYTTSEICRFNARIASLVFFPSARTYYCRACACSAESGYRRKRIAEYVKENRSSELPAQSGIGGIGRRRHDRAQNRTEGLTTAHCATPDMYWRVLLVSRVISGGFGVRWCADFVVLADCGAEVFDAGVCLVFKPDETSSPSLFDHHPLASIDLRSSSGDRKVVFGRDLLEAQRKVETESAFVLCGDFEADSCCASLH
jgi:hypothetical protein